MLERKSIDIPPLNGFNTFTETPPLTLGIIAKVVCDVALADGAVTLFTGIF